MYFTGRGDCFIEVLLDQMTYDPLWKNFVAKTNANSLRSRIVRSLETLIMKGKLEWDNIDPENPDIGSAEKWASKMAAEGTYCDRIFVQLASDTLCRKFVITPIFKPKNGKDDRVIITPMEASDEYEPFYFLYFSDKWFHSPHYQSVRPIEVAQAVEESILDTSDHNTIDNIEVASCHESYFEKDGQNLKVRCSIESFPDDSSRPLPVFESTTVPTTKEKVKKPVTTKKVATKKTTSTVSTETRQRRKRLAELSNAESTTNPTKKKSKATTKTSKAKSDLDMSGKRTTVSTETMTTRRFLRNVNALELSNGESTTKTKSKVDSKKNDKKSKADTKKSTSKKNNSTVSTAKTSKANSHLDVSKILGKRTRN